MASTMFCYSIIVRPGSKCYQIGHLSFLNNLFVNFFAFFFLFIEASFSFFKQLTVNKCLVCFKPMAPLCYWDTPYLDKLWYLKEKTRSIKTIFYFKRHKCRRSTKSLQKLFKGRKAAKSFERSFWDLAYF